MLLVLESHSLEERRASAPVALRINPVERVGEEEEGGRERGGRREGEGREGGREGGEGGKEGGKR